MEKYEIAWSAPEHTHAPKSKEWFWALGVITLAIALAALLLKNLLFVIFIVLAGFSVALHGTKKPKVIKFSINTLGIRLDDRLYPYESLKSFWIKYDPPHKKELEITSKKILMPHLTIPLTDTDPNEIRALLGRSLKEKETKESLAEVIADRLGF